MIEKVSGAVALNWSPTPYLGIAPSRLPDRSLLCLPLLELLQPATASAASPAAPKSACLLDSVVFVNGAFMETPLSERTVCGAWVFGFRRGGGELALDRAQHHAGDEVLLDEGVEGQDRDDGEHDGHRLDIGRDLKRGIAGRALVHAARAGGARYQVA